MAKFPKRRISTLFWRVCNYCLPKVSNFPKIPNQFTMTATRVAPGAEYCGNCSNSTEICPYCRSIRGVFHETYRKFKTCSSQIQQSTHHKNTNSKMSDNSTLSYSNTNSHLHKSLQETVGYLKSSSEVCRCAKNTRIPSSSTTNYTRATSCSSTDGKKLFVIFCIIYILKKQRLSVNW